jgi:hypothetical protein
VKWIDVDQTFVGNVDDHELKENVLITPIECTMVQLCITAFNGQPTIRAEFVGKILKNPMEALVLGAVDRLFALLIARSVNAPPDTMSGLVQKLVPDLDTYVGYLLRSHEQAQAAAKLLIEIMREIAVTRRKSSSRVAMDLFMAIEEDGPRKGQVPINLILEALIDLLLPFLGQDLRPALASILQAAAELRRIAEDPGCVPKAAPRLAEAIADALSLHASTVQGVVALAQGDWEGARDFCKPFCSLDPDTLDRIASLLPSVKKTLKKPEESLNDQKLDMQSRKLLANAKNESATKLMFDATDVDQSGYICVDEFSTLMRRLGFNLSEHKVVEVFTKCKQKDSKETDRLTRKEFSQAVLYIQHLVAHEALSVKGMSWPHLMGYLALLTVVLLMTFIFLFLGISAFVTGGVFGSVVNSMMTIGAGLGLHAKKSGAESAESSAEDMHGTLDMVEHSLFNEA